MPDSDWYRDVATMTGDAFYLLQVAPVQQVKFISESIAGMLGYSSEESMADVADLFAAVDPRDVQALRAALEQPPGTVGHLELRWQHKTAGLVTLEHWFIIGVREDGSRTVEGIARDISPRRLTESALRESEERFRNAMQHSAIAMCLVAPDGTFETVNAALCEFLGRDEPTLVATSWQTLTHPDDVEADLALVADVLAGRIDNYFLRKRFIRPDGSVVWGDLSVSCVRDEHGDVRHFVTQIVDVTAQLEAEQALRSSEAQYRLLVEESSDFLLRTKGTEGVIDWVSPSITRVLGWNPDDVIGRSALDFLHPDDHPGAHNTRELMDAGQQVSGRRRVLCSDGLYKWMLQVGRTQFSGDGATQGRISSFADIDAQVRAEQELAVTQAAAQAERQRLRAIMDAMLDPYFLVTPVRDEDGAIIDFEHVDANDAALVHAGFSRDDFIGSRLLELVPDQQAVVHLYAEAFESNRPVILDAVALTDPVDPSRRRLFDVRGVRVGENMSITVRDVTARVEAEEALAESQAHYRLLAENASDVVYRVHLDGTIQWLSGGVERVLGYDAEHLIGRDVDEFVHLPDQDVVDAAVEEALLVGRATVRFRVSETGGESRWLEATIHPIDEEDGKVLVGGCRDVHVEMQAMAELDRRARTDNLTGLPNRDEALSRLNLLLVKDRPHPTAVAFCDLDDFKTINDTFGHAVGDDWLREAAARIRSRAREGDLVARMGGDEILVVLPGVHTISRALRVCDMLREAIHSDGAQSTVSIGVTLGYPGEDVDTVIARADRAMYDAKRAGRNRVVALER